MDGRRTHQLTHCRINGLGVGEVLGGTARHGVNPVALVAPQPLSYLVPLHDDERRGDQLVAPRTGPHPQLSVHVPTNRVECREDLGPMAQGTTCGRFASHNIHTVNHRVPKRRKKEGTACTRPSSQRNPLCTSKVGKRRTPETASCGRFFGRKSTAMLPLWTCATEMMVPRLSRSMAAPVEIELSACFASWERGSATRLCHGDVHQDTVITHPTSELC